MLAMSSMAHAVNPTIQEKVGGESGDWPNSVQNNINKVSDKTVSLLDDEVDGFMKDIGMSVFEELTQFQPYSGKIGNAYLGAKVYRRVFANHDIFDSHTVIDTFEIPVSIPLWSASEALGSELSVGLSLGSSGHFKVENIRQVVPKALSTYPSWGDFSLKKEFFEKLNFRNLLRFFDESLGYTEEELKETNAYLEGERDKISEGEWLEDDRDKFYLARKFNNPGSKARYGKLLNLFTSPLKLPVKAKHLEKLHHGEIISYTADGLIQLTGSIGWSYNVTGVIDPVGGQISKSTYLSGKYRVSIIKEDKRFVRVKVSRLKTKGINTSFYPLTVKKTLLDGLAVIGIGLEQDVILTPFQFSSNKSTSDSFDVMYRYDLEQKSGVEAYEKAVWGFLKDSGDIAIEDEGSNSPAVEKLISKESKSKTKQKYKKFEINFVFKSTSSKSKTIDHSVIHIPSGPDMGIHYVKNGTVSRVREWSTIWNYKERKEEKFKVSLNEERINEGDIKGFGLSVEMNSYDNKTTGKELNSYIKKCHDMIGFDGVNRKIISNVPLKRPDVNKDGVLSGYSKAWYGESRFLCKSQYDWFHLQKFIYKTRDQKIAILEKVMKLERFKQTLKDEENSFNYENNITTAEKRAIDLLRHWEKLESISDDYIRLHEALTKMIDTTSKSYDMARVLHASCKERKVPFLVRAYNESFDHINLNEENFHLADNISSIAANQLAIDSIGPRTKYDRSAIVSGINTKILRNGNIELNFHLNQNPKFIFFDLQASKYDATRLRAKLIIQNKGEFKQGINKLVIGPGISRRISRFFSYFTEGTKYELGMAYSRDGIRWGGVSGHGFFYRVPKYLKVTKKKDDPKKVNNAR